MKQIFINIVGHNSSGKSTLARKLETDFAFNRISGDDFRTYVHRHIAYFKDTDMSYPNQRYEELNPLVIQYRFGLTWILLKAGQNILFEGSGATKEFRKRYLSKISTDFPDIIRIIIWTDLAEEELIRRLKERGQKWIDQYQNLKRHSFESPEELEADIVLRYDQTNYAAIKQALEAILR